MDSYFFKSQFIVRSVATSTATCAPCNTTTGVCDVPAYAHPRTSPTNHSVYRPAWFNEDEVKPFSTDFRFLQKTIEMQDQNDSSCAYQQRVVSFPRSAFESPPPLYSAHFNQHIFEPNFPIIINFPIHGNMPWCVLMQNDCVPNHIFFWSEKWTAFLWRFALFCCLFIFDFYRSFQLGFFCFDWSRHARNCQCTGCQIFGFDYTSWATCSLGNCEPSFCARGICFAAGLEYYPVPGF